MKNIFLNIIAVILGTVIGGIVNMGIIQIQDSIIPLPDGFNLDNFAESIKLLEPRHFIMPFIAHAIGTLVGAFIATLISPDRKLIAALIIGFFFLIGGISAVYMFGGPAWFAVIDLLLAYIPMAWIGYKIALSIRK